MECKMVFVLSIVVAVLFREMLFTEARMPGEDDNRSGQAGRIKLSKEDDDNGCRQKNQCQNDANQGQMNPGQKNLGQMNPGQMNPGQMHSGQMFSGRMYPGLMNPCQMNPGQMYPCQMNSGQMNPGQMNLGQMNPGQMPGVNGYGQNYYFSNSAQQPGVGRPSTYDTLSMDVSKQVVRQLTPLAHVALSILASYGQAKAMAPATAIRAVQPILTGLASAVQGA